MVGRDQHQRVAAGARERDGAAHSPVHLRRAEHGQIGFVAVPSASVMVHST
jgi:hypothetical protein